MKNIYLIPTDKPSRTYKIDSIGKLDWSEGYLQHVDGATTQNIYITSDEDIKEGDWVKLFVKHIDKEWIHKITKEDLLLYTDFNNEGAKIILTTDQNLIKDDVQAIDDEFLEWFVKNPSCEEAKVEITEISCIIPNFGDVDKYRIVIPKEESKTAWVGVLHDKLNEYHPAEYELKDIYQGEGCLPNFPNEELCQIWCDSNYKEVPKEQQKQHLINMMKADEELGLYEEPKQTDEKGKPMTYWGGLEKSKQEATPEEVAEYLGFVKGVKWQQEQDKNKYSGQEVFNLLMELSSRDRNSSSGTPHSIAKWFEQFKRK